MCLYDNNQKVSIRRLSVRNSSDSISTKEFNETNCCPVIFLLKLFVIWLKIIVFLYIF